MIGQRRNVTSVKWKPGFISFKNMAVIHLGGSRFVCDPIEECVGI